MIDTLIAPSSSADHKYTQNCLLSCNKFSGDLYLGNVYSDKIMIFQVVHWVLLIDAGSFSPID